MPIRRGIDCSGSYYCWGNNGHHYYYTPNNEISRNRAKNKAALQGRAIKANS